MIRKFNYTGRKKIKRIIIEDEHTDPECDDDWPSLWLKLACSLPGISLPPQVSKPDQVVWIEKEVESFCTNFNMLEKFVLSLYYFDQVCPAGANGIRKPGRDYRHILEPGYRYGHNHLIAGAYLVYTVHGLRDGLSKLLLYTPPHIESGFHHQLAQRQSLITNKGLMEAATLLYFSNLKGKPKSGAISPKKAGNLYRFIDVIQQLDLNYDLYSMTGEEVLQLLPAEFDQWKE